MGYRNNPFANCGSRLRSLDLKNTLWLASSFGDYQSRRQRDCRNYQTKFEEIGETKAMIAFVFLAQPFELDSLTHCAQTQADNENERENPMDFAVLEGLSVSRSFGEYTSNEESSINASPPTAAKA